MITLLHHLWQFIIGPADDSSQTAHSSRPVRPQPTATPAVQIALDDPLIAYFQSNPGAAALDQLTLDSPALRDLRAAAVRLVVPLVNQGELIGLINLGPRLSEQDYSADDRRLLDNLAAQAAPAVRIAQLARRQQAEAQERERLLHELQVARLIQQTLLPRALPARAGWQLTTHYQPAREVGGDFYDFLYFPDGRLGLIIADVTDKGVPAALVMATTRSILRMVAERLISPGKVLEQTNELLHHDIPPKMFVTCLYAVLDPATGRLQFANAGHDLPYRRMAHNGDVEELLATGMPLGLMPGMTYEEKEAVLEPGDCLLLYSDGLVEAHNAQREMFGFPRLKERLAASLQTAPDSAALVDFLLSELRNFTGLDWEQEDDVTLVILERTTPASEALRYKQAASSSSSPGTLMDRNEDDTSIRVADARLQTTAAPEQPASEAATMAGDWQTLAEFRFPSEPGNERRVAEQTLATVASLAPQVSTQILDRFKTAIGEAAMNAMEHGNQFRPELPVVIEILIKETALAVRITDQGGNQPIPEPETPDLAAKLAGLQSPRGWGLFLIKNMVDEMHVTGDEHHHTIELVLYL
jgi:serine phosphatase RsbU (regulator of sigma subunit)/anti-sigma regulatory factor (Ser/Thr protein kinase)